MPVSFEVRPCPKPGHVLSPEGAVIPVPEGWVLLEPGDAMLTRRAKATLPCWLMKRWRRGRYESLGLWVNAESLNQLRNEVRAVRQDDAYQERLLSARRRREKTQQGYAQEFESAVRKYLDFASQYADLEHRLARVISEHAVPVGSGTVARTRRILIEKRAEAATLAWLRHHTTDYDHMHVPHVKGRRREIRHQLARSSRQLLQRYRKGESAGAGVCPLVTALDNWDRIKGTGPQGDGIS